MEYGELARCLYPEELSDMDLIRIAFDAANKDSKQITVYHGRAVRELIDRFSSRKMNTSMWEAAEALRELDMMHPEGLGANAKEALSEVSGEMELKSVNNLATFVMTGSLHGENEKIAHAIKCLADHYVRGRFQYDDEEHFSILLYRCLRDEMDGKVLFEVASALELFTNKETLSNIQDALRGRCWNELPEVRRKLLSIERGLCTRLMEKPLEVAHHFANSRRRNSAPGAQACENTSIIVRRVGRA